MKLAVAIHTQEVSEAPPVALLSGTFDERLEKACRLGYDGVELMVARPGEVDASALKAKLSARGLEAAAVASGPIFMMDGLTLISGSHKAAERLFQLISLAGRLGAPLVTIGSFRGRVASAGEPGEAISRLTDLLLRAASWASSHEVRIALEPLNRYETDFLLNAAEGLKYLDDISHPCLGLLLDTFHMNIEEADILAVLAQVQTDGKLFHIHIGDSNRLPPGKGHMPFESIVRTLIAIGYNRYLSAELFPSPDPDSAALQTIQHMQGLIQKLEGMS